MKKNSIGLKGCRHVLHTSTRYLGRYFLLVFALCFSVSEGFAYDMPYYGGPWAVIHRDNRNSDYAPVEIADTYTPVYQTTRMQLPFNRPVIGPDKTIYYTYKGIGYAGFAGYLVGVDGRTGATKFNLGPPLLDNKVSATNVLAGQDGDVFISDDRALMRLTSDGKVVWRIPVSGVQASGMQFLSDGNLLMMTWNGIIYVIDPTDGEVLFEKNMTPLRNYPDEAPSRCLLDGDSDECVFANIPSINPFNNLFYQTVIAREGRQSAVNAYRYKTAPIDVELVWSNHTLDGGSASSVAISSDYTRLYVCDRANNLIALDAFTGEVLWKENVGYTASNSVVVNPNGYIVPGGNYRDPNFHLKIYSDSGSYAELVYENDDYDFLTSASAGDGDRFVIFGRHKTTKEVALLVVHPPEGIVGITPWGQDDPIPDRLTGLSFNTGGAVVVIGMGTVGVKLFTPIWPE